MINKRCEMGKVIQFKWTRPNPVNESPFLLKT
jgi:hypothetical protein